MTPRTVRIFSRECLVSVIILVSKWLRINIKIPLILNLNLLVLIKPNNLLLKLIVNKSSSGDIPAKIIKIAKQEIAEPIRNCINSSTSTGTFPDELKIDDIVPVFKKEDQNDKNNYRP